ATDEAVWAWGQNTLGQAGQGSTSATVLQPVKVASLLKIQAIAANGSFGLALDLDGQVWAWGQNTGGQVGTGSTSASVSTPTKVNGLPTIRAIAAGVNHALALDADGRVWSWGQNTGGQVGTGATSPSVLVPRQVANLPPVKAIAAGVGHSLAIDAQFGRVYTWGQNTFGQAGTGTASPTPVLTPSFVVGVSDAMAIAAGHNASYVILSGGAVRAWGLNVSGMLGNGSTANSASAVDVSGLTDAKAIAAGAQHALALRPGCPVWAWGSNGHAQLGTGTPISATTPVQSGLYNTYYFDSDGDGFGDVDSTEQACELPFFGYVEKIDCDDYAATTYPGAPELCNGVDDNCDDDVDEDNPGGDKSCATGAPGVCGSGKTSCTNGTLTCVQTQSASDERCDGLDNDCDGDADEDNPEGVQDCATGQQGLCNVGVTYCTGGVVHCAPKVPASTEVCDDLDNDCDGQTDEGVSLLTWYPDGDGDGYGTTGPAVQSCKQPQGYSASNTDCDDANAALHPGASEVCDGLDNNCNAQTDEGLTTHTWFRDADGDNFGSASTVAQSCLQPSGYVASSGDCNDANPAIQPNALETCDGVDNNCNATVDEGLLLTFYKDQDQDGYGSASQLTQACTQPSGHVSNANDCNDSNASIKPGGTEVCNGLDDDCDAATDEGVQTTFYRDADNDTYGTASATIAACTAPAGYVSNTSDCNDSNDTIKPGAAETCNGVDDNCSGVVDEGVKTTFYRDEDGDTYGASGLTVAACAAPQGYVANANDCNDSDASIKPGGTETCNGLDDNCSGAVDEGVKTTFYRDEDGDTYGASGPTVAACSAPQGYVANASDCNDNSASIKPGGTEVCNGLDEDCDGVADEGVQTTFFRDADNDGYGTSSPTVAACSAPAGYATNASDCNDYDASIRPGAAEVCNGLDEDCDGVADEGVQTTFYRDADNDGYGTSSPTVAACSAPAGYVSNTSDCNDGSASIKPGATETCNGQDDDCDAAVDEGVQLTFYRDADGDGYGTSSPTAVACSAPGGYAANASDCNDSNSSIKPGATEVCNGLDDNCSGITDEGVQTTFYRDADGDGYGSATTTVAACSTPAGYVSNTSDCNDGSASIKPGGTEVCNGQDDNCSGIVDEGNPGGGQSCNHGACGYWYTVCNGGAVQCYQDDFFPEEICRNNVDDDCDGEVDEGCSCFVAGTPISLADGST
ncbi:MopE-related protein, partial [Corallococcus terminator]